MLHFESCQNLKMIILPKCEDFHKTQRAHKPAICNPLRNTLKQISMLYGSGKQIAYLIDLIVNH